jgi:hypothetical protein
VRPGSGETVLPARPGEVSGRRVAVTTSATHAAAIDAHEVDVAAAHEDDGGGWHVNQGGIPIR